MLVLTRKVDEEIVLEVNGVEMVVKVVRIGPATVKIGIEAPTSAVIHRREIWDRIKEERECGSQHS